MAALFPGSVVLKQDAVGHGTMAATSECSTKYMTNFMETGKLPPLNTTCQVPENNPFLQSVPAGKRGLTLRRTMGMAV
ncbi:hypothetical protein K504DRAFT_247473 [Pleomassaria siparia CBS 279.74]|uniref:Peptidase S33 tripeptidyl aminopeptidase-like C-terminal domain-containing protein n=1 Tax=Pleomassaria siparia CBS 279.74 TaxID=1314801 RepID=A0A6G1KAN3_9PLEO|nr:hypothetical protein K504DRAFT_247473 [Pleomassaria siparia CBS 279.74]